MSLEQLIISIGYIGVFAIIFAESGLFFGFFLPGDSLLLTAGLLASRDMMNIWILVIILPIAAILGDNVGYWFGKKTGPRIFNRENSRLFKRKNLLAAKAFYDKHGGKTLVLAPEHGERRARRHDRDPRHGRGTSRWRGRGRDRCAG